MLLLSHMAGPKSKFDREDFDKVYEEYRNKIPLSEIYKKLKEIDSNLPQLRVYQHYIQKKEGQSLIKMTSRQETTDIDLINKGLAKAWKLGNIVMEKTLQEIKEKYHNGRKVSLQDRNIIMKWYSEAIKSYISGQTLKLRRKEDIRDQYKTAVLLRAARYGKLKETDIQSYASVSQH